MSKKKVSGSGVVELGKNVSCSEKVSKFFQSDYIIANRSLVNAVDCIRYRVLILLSVRNIYIKDISINVVDYDGIFVDEYNSSIEIILETIDSKITAVYREECFDGQCKCELSLTDENGKEIPKLDD